MDSADVGFRTWHVIDGRLRSPFLPVIWDERVLVAECLRCEDVPEPIPHAAPAPGCSCGIYASSEPDLDRPKVDFRAVTGIVTLGGRIEPGKQGRRAEYARIEALALYSRWTPRQKAAVWEIAEELDVDLVDLNEIATAAKRYGNQKLLATA